MPATDCLGHAEGPLFAHDLSKALRDMGKTLISLSASSAGLVLFMLGAACGQGASGAGSPASTVTRAGSPTTHGDSVSAREYVQDFYDRYVPMADSARRGPAFWRLLSADVLDSTLVEGLRADSAFGDLSSNHGTREGLNFDPFLASQDPCPRYEVMDTRADGPSSFRVTVKPVCADTTWQTQRPVMAVTHQDGRWKIVNVFYQRSDLRSLLCGFAKADRVPERRPFGC
jgi:hypothetical protein